jgi:hypothetical protein
LKIQVNSDKTIRVDDSMIDFVKSAVTKQLARFSEGVTRVEVHLSDVDSIRSGKQPDKRCQIEVRPRGAQPLSVTATAATVKTAVNQSLGKARRLLDSWAGRHGRSLSTPARKSKTARVEPRESVAPAPAATASVAPETPAVVKSAAKAVKKAAKKAAASKKTARKEPLTEAKERSLGKKKMIYQARRKSSPRVF